MRRPTMRLTAVFALALMTLLTAWPAAAQDDTEVRFPIDVYTCDTAPAIGDYDQTGLSGPPEGCVPAEGVIATVTSADGAELGTCTTNAEGHCTVPFQFSDAAPEVTVAVDESTMPEGYSRMQVNPITVPTNLEHGALFAGILTESQPGERGDTNLTVTALNCPPSGPDAELDPSSCTEPAAGIEFAIGMPNTGNVEFATTSEDGAFMIPLDPFVAPEGTSTISVGEILGSNPYGEVVGYTATCTNDVTGADVPVTYETGEVAPGGTTYSVLIDVSPGDQVSCIWRNSYQSATATTGPTISPPETPAADTTATITPGPGALQARIQTGDCDDSGALVSELTPAQLEPGSATGHEGAIPARTSVSTVTASLDALLAEDQYVAVYGSDSDAMVACGEIGGVPDDNGDLSMGLREIDDSGISGIAFLTPNGTNSGQTDISVFVAEGLSSDDGA